jgi:hypothetical protein
MSSLQTQTGTASPQDQDLTLANYGKALRVIGQDLAELFPRVLEIETDGVNFEARGESHPNPFEAIKESVVKKAWNRLFKKDSGAGVPPPTPASFARSYGPEEIDRLDRLSQAERSGTFRKADIYSLSERLRTMGAIVDSRNGRLKHLHKEADRLVVEYWDQQGQLQSAKLTTVILYRHHQQFGLQRQNAPLELWEGYDF